MRWNEVTALFGGSFDPPHLGHREAVRGLFAHPGVRAVRVIPTANAPHKPARTPVEHRIAMARLNFAATPTDAYPSEVEIDLCEIERARRTSAPTYSFETILEARARFGEVAFVIGTDQLRDLPQWSRFPAILGACHWIVLTRKPDGERVAGELLRDWTASALIAPEPVAGRFRVSRAVTEAARSAGAPQGPSSSGAEGPMLQLVSTEAPALSSTGIRESLQKDGRIPNQALLASVSSYLKEHLLYGS